jgi:hypothetical protein
VTAHRDLIALVAAAVACAAVAAAVPFEPVRVLAAAPLALVLPGLAVALASFGQRLPDLPVMVMLTLGLSLSVLAVGVVLLHVLPGRFGEASWAVLLVAVVGIGCLVAARRRGATPDGGIRLPPVPRLGRPAAALLAVAAIAVAATVVLASIRLPASDAIGYTRLWMLPSEPGAPVSHARIGVSNEEGERIVYRLALRIEGERTLRRMDLAPGEQRVWRITAPNPDPVKAAFVSARLFRADDPFTVYRRVNGWIPAG